jgi:hypothetical protein
MSTLFFPATKSPVMKEDFTKAMTLKELAAAYQVSIWTFKRWILPFREQIGEKVGWFYKPSQVKTILELLGEP